MKKRAMAILMIALLMALFCSTALASTGDLTAEDTKAYADAAMTKYVGTIQAGTSVLVRSYDTYADLCVNGKVVYVKAESLVHSEISTDYLATLAKGTKVYQQAKTSAKYRKLKKGTTVKLCAISGGWALVQSTGSKGIYAFVKVSKLRSIRVK